MWAGLFRQVGFEFLSTDFKTNSAGGVPVFFLWFDRLTMDGKS